MSEKRVLVEDAVKLARMIAAGEITHDEAFVLLDDLAISEPE